MKVTMCGISVLFIRFCRHTVRAVVLFLIFSVVFSCQGGNDKPSQQDSGSKGSRASSESSAEQGEVKYWTCTMHPSVKSKDPGTCPVCSMDLVPVQDQPAESPEAPASAKETGSEVKYWTCTMHPSVKSKDPGTCPVCAMDLVPVRDQPEPEKTAKKEALFTVNSERRQLLGVRFTEVSYQPITRTIRTVGRVEVDERRIAQIHTKVGGWVEKVYANFTYEHVKKGSPLFSIYSPDLVSTQEEYLLALKARDQLMDSSFPKAVQGSESLVDSARRRLKLWDINDAQIKELEETGKVRRTLTLYSPISGHVTYKNVFPGAKIDADTLVYTVVDHSYVWVHADIFENEIGLIRLGQEAEMTVPAYPGQVFRGKATYIWPHIQSETRTAKVRFEFPNPDLKLMPDMYANILLSISLGETLVVPESAVLRTGKRNLVFVDRGDGLMEVRPITLGQKADRLYGVMEGLKPGERVVTAANFLIDAESKVQGAIAVWDSDEGEP